MYPIVAKPAIDALDSRADYESPVLFEVTDELVSTTYAHELTVEQAFVLKF